MVDALCKLLWGINLGLDDSKEDISNFKKRTFILIPSLLYYKFLPK